MLTRSWVGLRHGRREADELKSMLTSFVGGTFEPALSELVSSPS